jgi:hypothetical protein
MTVVLLILNAMSRKTRDLAEMDSVRGRRSLPNSSLGGSKGDRGLERSRLLKIGQQSSSVAIASSPLACARPIEKMELLFRP